MTPTSTYSERLAKYVPAEVLAAYIAACSYVPTFETDQSKVIAFLVILFVSLVAVPIYYTKILPDGYSARMNCLVSMAALLVWAYAIGGPFAQLGWHHPGIGGILLVAFTLLSGAIKPK